MLFKNPTICEGCLNKFKPVLNKFKIGDINAYHLYFYNDFVKENLYQFKGCFDIELAPTFLEFYIPFLRIKYFGYTIIPAPSFSESDDERGFNHVVKIFSYLKLPILSCIEKTKKIKQSDLSSDERKNVKDYLKINFVDITKKKILIVDDVYTTGSTIKAMIELVQSLHPKKIKVLVMSKTPDIVAQSKNTF